MPVDLFESCQQALAALMVEVLDALPQALDRLLEVVVLLAHGLEPRFQLARLFFSAKVDAAQLVALVLELLQLAFHHAAGWQRRRRRKARQTAQLLRLTAEMLADLPGQLIVAGARGNGAFFVAGALLAGLRQRVDRERGCGG